MAAKRSPSKRAALPDAVVTRVLIPVDFSAASLSAAAFGLDLARQLGAAVRCTTVIDVLDLHVAMRTGLDGFETNADLQRQVGKWIDDEFEKLAVTSGVAFDREVRRGVPETEILAAVRRYAPDLVVMGSTGIARRLPLGSRAAAVMRGTIVPVLVVRPA
jgi:nucleotide-binding universal stress UspA family protein